MAKLIDKSLFSITDESGTVNLFSISLPVFLNQIINQAISFITTALLSNFDTNMVTAISANSMFASLLSVICNVGACGLAIILAHDLGKGDKKSVENLVFNGLIVGYTIFFICGSFCLIFCEQLLSTMSLTPEVMAFAKRHFIAQVFNVGMGIFGNILLSAMRCHGKVIEATIISIVQVILSAVFMVLFIYTPLGSYADMMTNIIVRNIALTFLVQVSYFIVFKSKKLKIGNKLNRSSLKRISRVGFPGSVSAISYNLSSLITTTIMASISMEFINYKLYITNIVTFVAFFGNSLGYSASVLIGRAKGAGHVEKVDKMHKTYLYTILLINLTLSLICFAFSKPLFSIFDPDPAHYALIWQIFLVDVLVETGRGGNHACEGTLNAVGEVKYTTLVSILSCWICAVGLSYLFVNVLGWGITGVWIALGIDEWCRATLYEIRWRKGKWVEKII